jgi:hypothetical protein
MISAFVDALEIDGRDPEVAVPELALDDDERYAFAGHLVGVSVSELVGREASANTSGRRGAPELRACPRGAPVASARRSFDDADERADR